MLKALSLALMVLLLGTIVAVPSSQAYATPVQQTPGDTLNSLTVSISGLRVVRPNATCTWFANVSGGTPPYSYAWYANGIYVGAYEDLIYKVTSSQTTIAVWVSDAAGGSVSTSINVTTSSTARACFL